MGGASVRRDGRLPRRNQSAHCQARRAAPGGWGSRGRGPVLPARPHSLDRGCWCEAGRALGGTHSPGAAGGAAPGRRAPGAFSGPCCPRPLSRTQAACVTTRSHRAAWPSLALPWPSVLASWAPAPQARSPAAAVCVLSRPGSGGSGGSSWSAWGCPSAVAPRLGLCPHRASAGAGCGARPSGTLLRAGSGWPCLPLGPPPPCPGCLGPDRARGGVQVRESPSTSCPAWEAPPPRAAGCVGPSVACTWGTWGAHVGTWPLLLAVSELDCLGALSGQGSPPRGWAESRRAASARSAHAASRLLSLLLSCGSQARHPLSQASALRVPPGPEPWDRPYSRSSWPSSDGRTSRASPFLFLSRTPTSQVPPQCLCTCGSPRPTAQVKGHFLSESLGVSLPDVGSPACACPWRPPMGR